MTTTIKESAPAPAPRSAAPKRHGGFLMNVLEKYGLLVLLVVLVIVFALGQPAFMTVRNWQAIGLAVAVSTFLALALLVPILAGKFDLSVGNVLVLGSLVAARGMSEWGLGLWPSILITVLVGVVIGVVNGLLVTKLGVNDFVATLGTATVLVGMTSWFSGDRAITSGFAPELMEFGRGDFLGIPLLVIAALVAAALIAYVVKQTPFGRQLAAIGSNQTAATLVGVRVDRNVITSYIISGGIAAFAGVLLISAQASATPALQGMGLLIPGLAAIFLGASVFTPGKFNVLGTLVGLVVVALTVSGLTLFGVPAWVSNIVNGVLLVGAVAASQFFKRQRGSKV